ncbi:MAG: glycosyltransferase [Promethearchaeota archaeon]
MEPTNITFSILMASYNSSEYIKEAIESVISQTYPYWELIIIDDASSDDSIKIITPFLKDKRIKLFIHKKNQGGGATYKEAATHASKEIIAFLDWDDKLRSDALETMAKAYRHYPDCGLIYSSHWVCDENLNIKNIPSTSKPPNPNKTNLIERTASHFLTIKREVYNKVGGFNPNFKVYGDGDIIFKVEEISKLKFIDKSLYYHRIHNKSVSRRYKSQVFREEYLAKLNAFTRRLTKNIPNLTYNQIYNLYYQVLFFKLANFLLILKEYFHVKQIFHKYISFFNFLPPNVKKKVQSIFKKIFF